MKTLSGRVVAIGFVLALMLLGGVGTVTYLSTRRLLDNKQQVEHTYRVLRELDEIQAGINLADSSEYILTPNGIYLSTYTAGIVKSKRAFETVRRLTDDNPRQQNRLEALDPLLSQRFALMQQLVKILEQDGLGLEEQEHLDEQVRQLEKQIQTSLAEMKREEEYLLHRRSVATTISAQQVLVMISLGYAVSFSLLVWVYRLFQRQVGVTQRLSNEAIRLEHEAAQAQLSSILESVTDAFVALDRNWCYTYVN